MSVAGGGAAAAFGGGRKVPTFSVPGSTAAAAGVEVEWANGRSSVACPSQERALFGNTIASPGSGARLRAAVDGGTDARPPKNGSSSVMDPRALWDAPRLE
jgi:hypothetical protein